MNDTLEKKYKKLARSVSIPSSNRNAELSKIIQGDTGDERDMAICEMVNGHMRMVLNLTSRYHNMPDFIDTVYDGNLGLVKAVLTFDSNKGKFSTWATPKILTEVRNGILSRLNSPLSVSRYASELAFKIKDILPNENGDVLLPDIPIVKLAMIGVMDSISIYNEDGEVNDVADPNAESALDIAQRNDLLALVHRATSELGLSDDEITLIAESRGKSHQDGIAPLLAKERRMSKANVRMIRAKLLWKIRRKILGYVGKDEYLMLSAVGHIPSSNWR